MALLETFEILFHKSKKYGNNEVDYKTIVLNDDNYQEFSRGEKINLNSQDWKITEHVLLKYFLGRL